MFVLMDQKNRGIVPRKIKGFRDSDPYLNRLRWHIIESASRIYKMYGFEHWDTPAVEYAENLGKYLPDSDTVEEGIYSFKNPELEPVLASNGKELRDENDLVVMDHHFLSLRYDLTAPLARLYAENLWYESQKGELVTERSPLFRRYQYGPVYRFEAKLDPGRFREFWQIDFDSVGTSSPAVDAETCVILSESMEAIGLKRDSYTVKVNNRKILKGFLNSLGITKEEQEQSVLRIIDKFDKIGLTGIRQELGKGRKDDSGAIIPGLELSGNLISGISEMFEFYTENKTRKEILDYFERHKNQNELMAEGIEELITIDSVLSSLEFDESRIVFDPTLVRGMAYYTGPVFEVVSNSFFTDDKGRKRKVGSICGGGRYDGLVERLLGVKIPATGSSIGVDRLAEFIVLTKQIELSVSGPVMIVVFDSDLMPEYQKIAGELRSNGIQSEIYYGMQRGLKKQLTYADKKNSPFAIFLGGDELEKGTVTVKNLILGKEATNIQDKSEWKKKVQIEMKREELVTYLRNNLT
ncbi:MAG: histidine--tRNA ligase [Bacteroidales bacterium]|nr:histidine--tRNA ligase [Bacteroidales bacterium]